MDICIINNKLMTVISKPPISEEEELLLNVLSKAIELAPRSQKAHIILKLTLDDLRDEHLYKLSHLVDNAEKNLNFLKAKLDETNTLTKDTQTRLQILETTSSRTTEKDALSIKEMIATKSKKFAELAEMERLAQQQVQDTNKIFIRIDSMIKLGVTQENLKICNSLLERKMSGSSRTEVEEIAQLLRKVDIFKDEKEKESCLKDVGKFVTQLLNQEENELDEIGRRISHLKNEISELNKRDIKKIAEDIEKEKAYLGSLREQAKREKSEINEVQSQIENLKESYQIRLTLYDLLKEQAQARRTKNRSLIDRLTSQIEIIKQGV